MAKRWSFEEDYIVCKFCIEKQYRDIEHELLWELVDRLAEAGSIQEVLWRHTRELRILHACYVVGIHRMQ